MKVIKNEPEDLSIEEARQFECCKDLNDEEISELLETMRSFAEIAYCTYAKKHGNDGGTPYNIAS